MGGVFVFAKKRHAFFIALFLIFITISLFNYLSSLYHEHEQFIDFLTVIISYFASFPYGVYVGLKHIENRLFPVFISGILFGAVILLSEYLSIKYLVGDKQINLSPWALIMVLSISGIIIGTYIGRLLSKVIHRGLNKTRESVDKVTGHIEWFNGRVAVVMTLITVIVSVVDKCS